MGHPLVWGAMQYAGQVPTSIALVMPSSFAAPTRCHWYHDS
jgi:hypothetical protein